MAYYRQCSRCGCTLDSSEGTSYPGEGLVCEECVKELEAEDRYRKFWSLSKEQLQGMKQERPDFWPHTMEGTA